MSKAYRGWNDSCSPTTMRKTLLLLVLLLMVSASFGQENQVTSSSLVGSWVYDQTVKGAIYDTVIFKKVDSNQQRIAATFSENGRFNLTYNWGHRRCGNDLRLRTIEGSFYLNSETKELQLTSSKVTDNQVWKLLWVHSNSFGVKRVIRKRTS